jgi:hypothetical protein
VRKIIRRATLGDISVGARLLWDLPSFLRQPLRPDEARATVRRRLAQRGDDFLALARRSIYGQPTSPYGALLKMAGCEYGDLQRLVRLDGLEGALRTLSQQGLYLTVDELKGRRPLVRGSARIEMNPAELRDNGGAGQISFRRSASRGAGTTAAIKLSSVREQAIDTSLVLEARGAAALARGHWGVPGGAAIGRLLEFQLSGSHSVAWFTQVDHADPGLHRRYRWSARALQWASRRAGPGLIGPIHVPVDQPLPIAHWMVDTLHRGRRPHLWTFVSPAVRLCQAAFEAGLDLRGVELTIGGEPTTTARLEAIRRVGASATPVYASTETGLIGYGCLEPQAADDLHLLSDLHAVIRVGTDGRDGPLPGGTLLMSSLRSAARFVLLNVSLGDQAQLVTRRCGCPLEELGWTAHLHNIRSCEKLTAGGMTRQDADVIKVLEQVLPARFGGCPTDYQLVEDETEAGQIVLRLLAHPRLGPLDTDLIADVFLAAIGGGSGSERITELQWRQAGWLRVERQQPLATASGKILHLRPSSRGSADQLPAGRAW